MGFLDQFSVLLLDMNGTFMFGHDRFGSEQDYFATYCALGGGTLSRDLVREIMTTTCDALLKDYDSQDRYDNFPTLVEAFLVPPNVEPWHRTVGPVAISVPRSRALPYPYTLDSDGRGHGSSYSKRQLPVRQRQVRGHRRSEAILPLSLLALP